MLLPKFIDQYERPKHVLEKYTHHSLFQIVHAPYAIAIPAAILANGAMKRIMSPNPIHTQPSHVVRSFIRLLIYALIIICLLIDACFTSTFVACFDHVRFFINLQIFYL